MRYMLLHCVDESLALPPKAVEDIDRQLGAWLDDTIARGVSLHGARLHPVHAATTVRVREDRALVADGPLTETKEQIGSHNVIEAVDLDEAIEAAARHPTARIGTIEIRPVFESWRLDPTWYR